MGSIRWVWLWCVCGDNGCASKKYLQIRTEILERVFLENHDKDCQVFIFLLLSHWMTLSRDGSYFLFLNINFPFFKILGRRTLLRLSHYIPEYPITYCHLVVPCFIGQAAPLVSVCPLWITALNTRNKTLASKKKKSTKISNSYKEEKKAAKDFNEVWQTKLLYTVKKNPFWLKTSVIGNYISKWGNHC